MREHYVMAIFFTTIFVSLSYVFGKNALHMFQQQHYELKRYSKWLFNRNNIHKTTVFYYFAAEIICFLIGHFSLVEDLYCLLAAMLITIAYATYLCIKEARHIYIIDLVLTKRVIRQIIVFTILDILLIFVFLWFTDWFYVCGILSVYGPYLLIYPMHIITKPIEELIKKYYENDARKKLNDLSDLRKIGITGSFGKTSTKNIVNDIISNNFYTQITPGSFNTPMGITRTIREHLRPIHEIFVCEMGADKVGDISYLMDFVKPQMGVVTSIGPQHLQTFKSMENIIEEKMQEIEMLPQDGVGFINLDNEYIRKYRIKNTCKIVSVGIDSDDADIVAKDIKYTNTGSSFSVKIGKKTYNFETSLLGKHNITNILIGIAIALELNIPINEIVSNVSKVAQVEHRLQVKKLHGFTVIDDAFNSNPVGSKMACDVLSMMPGKRIMITPGMIDLGKKQEEVNEEFGRYMADKVDFVLLVGERQTKPICHGLKKAGYDMHHLRIFDNTKDALHYAYSRFSTKDTILIENDLPDAFNA